MANKQQLKILRQGVKVWNNWREEKPNIRPDLSRADLAGLALRHAYLNATDFTDANLTHTRIENSVLRDTILRGADLSVATLVVVDLTAADLTTACLDGASLTAVRLVGSKLTNAKLRFAHLSEITAAHTDLKEVDLSRALLSNVVLDHADLTGAKLGETVFAATDLSSAIGLETVKHGGPSTIGIDTIYKSKGKIPEIFLRGCGVPEDFISYARSLVTNPIEYYSCFISYSSKDKDFADRLHADLQAKAIRCWYAPEDLKIGDKFRTRIEESIRIYDKVMIALSENSIQSAWVEDEVEAGLERERQKPGSLVLFPIRLDDAVMETNQAWAASLRRTRHIGDFSNWKNHESYQKGFERLLRDLKAQTRAAPASK